MKFMKVKAAIKRIEKINGHVEKVNERIGDMQAIKEGTGVQRIGGRKLEEFAGNSFKKLLKK